MNGIIPLPQLVCYHFNLPQCQNCHPRRCLGSHTMALFNNEVILRFVSNYLNVHFTSLDSMSPQIHQNGLGASNLLFGYRSINLPCLAHNICQFEILMNQNVQKYFRMLWNVKRGFTWSKSYTGSTKLIIGTYWHDTFSMLCLLIMIYPNINWNLLKCYIIFFFI